MSRERYAREYSGSYHSTAPPIIIPDDVERMSDHAPCTYCGVRPDVACRHRPWSVAA